MNHTFAPAAPASLSPGKNHRHIGRRRWLICALVFFATTINYMDRTVLGLLAPLLQNTIGWNEKQYGYIVTAFQVSYALGLLFMGPLVDRVGSRIGYAVAIAIWSLSAMAHSLARSVTTFAMARFGLGFGEAGNFPSALKAVAEWFPKRERALATGIFNSGTNIGATVAPLVVPWIALHLGWQYAFLLTGLFSAVWIVCWLKVYRNPLDDPKLSRAELEYIQSDPVQLTAKIP
jgi:ACS family hexuronate transporter-like MFS transporter